MKLVTGQEMKEIDRIAIEKYKIPSLQLMEKAGFGTAQVAGKMLGEVRGKTVFIFCGKGNNGGDGFVAGMYLAKQKAKGKFFLLGKKTELKGDAQVNLKKALKIKLLLAEIADLKKIPEKLECDLIIDAIFGTGFKGEVAGLEKEVIKKINESKIPVLAVDIPSGIDADSGKWLDSARHKSICVQASETVTMGLPKIAQVFYPGKEFCGELTVVDIGIPEEVIQSVKSDLNFITKDEVKKFLPQRPGDVHKGDCGKIFILAGSTGLTGAACLASLSVLRIGAGLVTLGVPETLNPIFEIKLTEVITKPLPDVGKKGALALRGLGGMAQLLENSDCHAIGPGLGRHFETLELVRRLVTSRINKPLVLDADGLNAFAKDSTPLKNLPYPVILTPHIGELSRLINLPIKEIARDRVYTARKVAQEYNLILVLKGAPTLVAEPSGQVYVNSTGNPGMATAGSGDILTGMIVGLLGQKLKLDKEKPSLQIALESALCGVYLHGLCGDLAKKGKTEYGLIAGDILEKIPEGIKTIIQKI